MKKIALFLVLTSTVFAALPPFAQSSREIKQILNDPRLYEILGSAESIDQIVRAEGGYEIKTRTRSVYVQVIRVPTGRIGPSDIDLKFNEQEPGISP